MKKAADDDRESNQISRPAVEKSKMIQEVTQTLEIGHFHLYLIEQVHILDAIRDWLMPLPDGSLPEYSTRTELYRLIRLLHLERFSGQDLHEYLATSKQATESLRAANPEKGNFLAFGKLIKFLCTHPKETAENRKLLRGMLLSWCRPLIALTGNGQNTTSVPRIDQQEEIQARSKKLRSRVRYVDTIERSRPRVPEKPWFDFARAPPKRQEPLPQMMPSGTSLEKQDSIMRTFRHMGGPKKKRMRRG